MFDASAATIMVLAAIPYQMITYVTMYDKVYNVPLLLQFNLYLNVHSFIIEATCGDV